MKFEEFLVKAKINTYARSGEGGERILEDGSKELVCKSGEWKYRDRYFGSSRFIGEEIVWESEKIRWGMNYYGAMISEEIEMERLYPFLQKALRLVREERPFRGPGKLQEEDWEYLDESSGTVERFHGWK
jgi:hypothetical protein